MDLNQIIHATYRRLGLDRRAARRVMRSWFHYVLMLLLVCGTAPASLPDSRDFSRLDESSGDERDTEPTEGEDETPAGDEGVLGHRHRLRLSQAAPWNDATGNAVACAGPGSCRAAWAESRYTSTRLTPLRC